MKELLEESQDLKNIVSTLNEYINTKMNFTGADKLQLLSEESKLTMKGSFIDIVGMRQLTYYQTKDDCYFAPFNLAINIMLYGKPGYTFENILKLGMWLGHEDFASVKTKLSKLGITIEFVGVEQDYNKYMQEIDSVNRTWLYEIKLNLQYVQKYFFKENTNNTVGKIIIDGSINNDEVQFEVVE